MTNHSDKSFNVNTILISAGGFLVAILIAIVGFFCKAEFESVNTKLDNMEQMKADVVTIKTQLPYMQQQIDSLKSSVWGNRYGMDVSSPSTITPPIHRNP